jgi:hypothetical protein
MVLPILFLLTLPIPGLMALAFLTVPQTGGHILTEEMEFKAQLM